MKRYQPSIEPDQIPQDLRALVSALCRVAEELALTIARGPIGQSLGDDVGENADGDSQTALDILADRQFAAALAGTSVRWYASEERQDVASIDLDGAFALAIDPLDGSYNIGVNVSIGALFSIYGVLDDPLASFLRPANQQIAAGYFIYGPQTALVVTFGGATLHFVLEPQGRVFQLVNDVVSVPDGACEYAINTSNYRHWAAPVRAHVDDCMAGATGPRAQNFNMRWVASLVAETHRILMRGGVFLYPADDRPGYQNGRLRKLCECAPVALIIGQAGGLATDGQDAILGQSAVSLHARTPLVFGGAEQVARITSYHDFPAVEVSALFNTRGLFRTRGG